MILMSNKLLLRSAILAVASVYAAYGETNMTVC